MVTVISLYPDMFIHLPPIADVTFLIRRCPSVEPTVQIYPVNNHFPFVSFIVPIIVSLLFTAAHVLILIATVSPILVKLLFNKISSSTVILF